LTVALRALIRRMSVENLLWGAPRIHGELLKLGFAVAQSTVAKYMANRGARDQRSISPNTMSSEPMIAETSANICPRLKKSIACRWANDGARILHL
jgi:hypothetical protein